MTSASSLGRRHVMRLGASAAALPMLRPAVSRAQALQVLRFVPAADLAVLDPLNNRIHGNVVFDTLYGLDSQFLPQPQMLDGHSIENEGKLWTLTLRTGLMFHDGTPVLARDCVASIERWCKRDPFGQTLLAVSDELSAPNDRQIRFRLKRTFPQLPYALGKGSNICFMMPQRLARSEGLMNTMVGSGPFRFNTAEHQPGALIVYDKFTGYVPRDGQPDFMAGAKIPYLDRIEWHVIPDASTAASALQAGEVDWWEQPSADFLPMLRSTRGVKVAVKDKSGALGYLRFNCLTPPFDNPAIRRALLGGIDQADLMTATIGTDHALWQDNIGFFPPGTALANDAGLGVLEGPRDLDRVRRDLAAAGYKGETIAFVVPADMPGVSGMSEVCADLMRKVGMNVDYQALDRGTVLSRVASQKPADQGGWNAWCYYMPGVLALNPASHSYMRGQGARGAYGWPTSAKLEALRDSFLDATDPAEQKRIATAMQAQAFQDVPYIPTGFYLQPTAFRDTVSGILDGMPVFYNVRKS